MVKISPTLIFMSENVAERETVKSDFFKIAGFPGILDDTHIPNIAPSTDDEYFYVNRRKFRLINVKAVFDANAYAVHAVFLNVIKSRRVILSL